MCGFLKVKGVQLCVPSALEPQHARTRREGEAPQAPPADQRTHFPQIPQGRYDWRDVP
jgi:hypothetical protein